MHHTRKKLKSMKLKDEESVLRAHNMYKVPTSRKREREREREREKGNSNGESGYIRHGRYGWGGNRELET